MTIRDLALTVAYKDGKRFSNMSDCISYLINKYGRKISEPVEFEEIKSSAPDKF